VLTIVTSDDRAARRLFFASRADRRRVFVKECRRLPALLDGIDGVSGPRAGERARAGRCRCAERPRTGKGAAAPLFRSSMPMGALSDCERASRQTLGVFNPVQSCAGDHRRLGQDRQVVGAGAQRGRRNR